MPKKKAKKKRTSDTMNKTIPKRRLFCTKGVWWKVNVPSLITSRHQKDNIIIRRVKPISNKPAPFIKKWNKDAAPNVI